MARCSKHKGDYWTTEGRGKNRYSYCTLCRSLRITEAAEPGTTAKVEAFLHSDETKKELKALDKSSSVKIVSVAQLNAANEDGERRTDDELLSGGFRNKKPAINLRDLQDTSRLRDAITGVMKGSVRDAASKYGLNKDLVFRVRLIIESKGLDAGVEMLLAHLNRKIDAPQDDDKGPIEKFKAMFGPVPPPDSPDRPEKRQDLRQ